LAAIRANRGMVYLLLLVLQPAQAAVQSSISTDLQSLLAAPGVPAMVSVIVRYRASDDGRLLRQELSQDAHAVRRHDVVQRLLNQSAAGKASIVSEAQAAGATNLRVLWIANSVSMNATPALIQTLSANPQVEQIRVDGVLAAPIAYPGLVLPAEWNIAMVDAPSLWARGIRGQGAVVASLDSGVDGRHPDLAGNWRGGSNSWFDPHAQHSAPADVSGHGTQVMGVMVGGSVSGTHIGVAPDAKWIAAKIFDDTGATSESAVHRAMQWLLDPDGNPATDDAPDVVNNSWDISAEDTCNSVFQPDIDALRAADIAVVFSAGNYGPSPSTSASPANTTHVVSVGAIDDQQHVAAFSSRGPSACDGELFPKLVAPGDGVLTTDLSFGGTPSYVLVAGTSFASPHVAAAIALMRSASPLSSVDQIEAALTATASDIAAAGRDQDSGYGLINLPRALDALPRADEDGDGYGAGRDCNDRDASIHPGAVERARDGVDQDCNGFDLTIEVKYAVYSHDGNSLNLRASSSRGATANLEIVGVGPLTWREPYGDWIYEGSVVTSTPRITISGTEGAVIVSPRRPSKRR
jgi:serine protease AprX